MALVVIQKLISQIEDEKSHDDNQDIIKIDTSKVTIREMKENEVEEANRIVQRAFYDFIKDPGCLQFMYVHARRHVNEIYVAEYEHQLIGIGMAVHWGSIRVWGPICVSPQFQQNGIGKMIINHIDHSLDTKDKDRRIKRDVLFTFVGTHHIGFYMSIGMTPQKLTWITSYDLNRKHTDLVHEDQYTFEECYDLKACRALTHSIYDGLDLSVEIEGYRKYKDIGVCVGLCGVDGNLVGFGICSFGPLSEAPRNGMKIKFGAATSGRSLCCLLSHIIEYAKERGLGSIEVGVNIGNVRAFDIVTGVFEFEYNAKRPNISMGKVVGDDKQEYDDYRNSNSYVVGDWR